MTVNQLANLIFCLLLMATTAVYPQTYIGSDTDIQLILKNIKAFSRSYMAADYEALANAYTTDAKILPPGAGIIAGRESIKKRWTIPATVKILLHEIHPEEITVVGDIAYDVGHYNGKTKRADGSEVEWKGKYLIVWKKIGDDWKIYADAWNTVD